MPIFWNFIMRSLWKIAKCKQSHIFGLESVDQFDTISYSLIHSLLDFTLMRCTALCHLPSVLLSPVRNARGSWWGYDKLLLQLRRRGTGWRALLIVLQKEHKLFTIFVLGSQLPVLLFLRVSRLIYVLRGTTHRFKSRRGLVGCVRRRGFKRRVGRNGGMGWSRQCLLPALRFRRGHWRLLVAIYACLFLEKETRDMMTLSLTRSWWFGLEVFDSPLLWLSNDLILMVFLFRMVLDFMGSEHLIALVILAV